MVRYRKIFLVVMILCITFSKVQAQPNIIFILADDLGYGELGTYGATDVVTPALDNLAEKGAQYNRAYSNSTVCSPSRASILFGDYPDKLGVPGVIRDMPHNTWGNLREDIVSMPDLFKKQGYHTALIGKWHLGYQSPDLPNDRGFDFFKGFVGDMMDDYTTHLRGGVNWMRENKVTINPQGHATDLFTEWTMDYIAERKNADQPFFLFLAYNAPHDPVQPPSEFLEKVQKRLPDISFKRQKMIALIEHLDYNIGKVLEGLKDQNINEETIVVFTSDNGGALNYAANNGPFNGGKGDMYEGGIRVPCLLSWPGKIEPTEINSPFLLMDFYKLLPQLSKKTDNEPINLRESQSVVRENMIWVRREGHRFGGQAYYAISDGTHKYLQNSPFEPFKLFDIKKDSLEMSPIKDKTKEKELLKELTNHIQESGKTPWQ